MKANDLAIFGGPRAVRAEYKDGWRQVRLSDLKPIMAAARDPAPPEQTRPGVRHWDMSAGGVSATLGRAVPSDRSRTCLPEPCPCAWHRDMAPRDLSEVRRGPGFAL